MKEEETREAKDVTKEERDDKEEDAGEEREPSVSLASSLAHFSCLYRFRRQ